MHLHFISQSDSKLSKRQTKLSGLISNRLLHKPLPIASANRTDNVPQRMILEFAFPPGGRLVDNRGPRMTTSFQNQTWKEIGDAMRRDVVVILPIGSTEAHGPHLPLGTDVIISEELAVRAAVELEKLSRSVLIAPSIAYSVTEYAGGFAGTVSVGQIAAIAVIADVACSLIAPGL